MPAKSTNVTPSDTPPILILPRMTPTDITIEYSMRMCATDCPLVNSSVNQFIILLYFACFVYLPKNGVQSYNKLLNLKVFSCKIQQKICCSFHSEQRTVDADVIRAAVSPVCFAVEVVVFTSLVVGLVDDLTCLCWCHTVVFAYKFHTVVVVGADEDAEQVGEVAQDVVTAASYDDAAFRRGFLEADVGLYLEQ